MRLINKTKAKHGMCEKCGSEKCYVLKDKQLNESKQRMY